MRNGRSCRVVVTDPIWHSAEEREGCERQANGAKEKYYAELAEYKKTPNYEAYQKYLEDFKAKHSVPTKGLFTISI